MVLGESFPTHIYLQNLASIQPLRYLQFLKIVRSTATAAAENEPCKVCPLSVSPDPPGRFEGGAREARADPRGAVPGKVGLTLS